MFAIIRSFAAKYRTVSTVQHGYRIRYVCTLKVLKSFYFPSLASYFFLMASVDSDSLGSGVLEVVNRWQKLHSQVLKISL